MAGATREIKRRIRSVGSTEKITKAMELVSSVKMRKTSQVALATRPYANRSWDMLLHLTHRTDQRQHPLLRVAPVPKKVCIVLLATNRGYVGGFNNQVIAAVHAEILLLKKESGTEADIVLMGTKGRAVAKHFGHNVVAEFTKQDIVTSAVAVRPLAKFVIDGFAKAEYDRVSVGYMEAASPLVQKPRIRQILPITAASFETGELGLVRNGERSRIVSEEARSEQQFEYLFEPNVDEVLEQLLPRLVETQIYRAVLETNASEHAARMLSMRNASDAASDLIDDLTLTFNQVRQAGITQDLSEISASRIALES